MRRSGSRAALASLVASSITLAATGAAMAVSGGGYQPSRQDCPANADANDNVKAAPGCHSFKLNIQDTRGRRYAEVGVDQTPQQTKPDLIPHVADGPTETNWPHSGCFAVNGDGTNQHCGAGRGLGAAGTFDTEKPQRTTVSPQTGTSDVGKLIDDLLGGADLYLGSDDNLDFGEHDGAAGVGTDHKADGSTGSVNGPSDGGAVQVRLRPKAAADAPSAVDLLPVLGLSEGACADGFCQEVTTRRQTIYHGTGAARRRDVADYEGKQFDPYNCSSGDRASEGPGCKGGRSQPQTMDQWRAAEARNVDAEPGAQVYEDPDPQSSPLDPLFEADLSPTGKPLDYPLPAVYAGSCGVILGGGTAPKAPASPVTNKAGQVRATNPSCAH